MLAGEQQSKLQGLVGKTHSAATGEKEVQMW